MRVFGVLLSSLFLVTACGAPDAGLTASKSGKKKTSTSAPSGDDDDATDPDPERPAQTPTSPERPTTTPATDDGTHGTGGTVGDAELKSTGGLSYLINAPAIDAAKPIGVLVLLHGSTASNYREMIGMMANVAADQGFIRVSVLAPNGQGWNEGDQPAAAEKLHQLIQQDLFPKYNIDKTRVLFSGQSSGAGFLSSHFITLHAKDYQGGAFLQCGAAPPFQSFAPDDATKKGFKMHFEITSGDPIWPQSYAQATAAYQSAGMTFTKDDTKPGGHCQFDQQQVILDHIATVLAR